MLLPLPDLVCGSSRTYTNTIYMNSKLLIILVSVLTVLILYLVKYNELPLYNYLVIYSITTIANPIYKYTSLVGNEPFYKDSLLKSSTILTKLIS